MRDHFQNKFCRQGIVHIIGPEQGFTQPGMTIVCGDLHTATHGAFGSLAFGIGTSEVKTWMQRKCVFTIPLRVLTYRSNVCVCVCACVLGGGQVEHVLATQTLVQAKAKNMRVQVKGTELA